jgi:hypothetical protein
MVTSGLRKIIIRECPDCKNGRVSECIIKNLHTCGEWNEYLKFECGYEIHYSPNYGSVMKTRDCERSKMYKIKKDKRREANEKLVHYINSLDCDKEHINKLIDGLNFPLNYF